MINTELMQQLKDSNYAWKAMKANLADAALPRWNAKEPLENVLLTSMETLDGLSFAGPGCMRVSNEQSLYGTTSVKMVTPTKFGLVPEHHRFYTRSQVVFDAKGADWTHYNRISFWIYPDCPGYQNVWLSMTINNDGEVKYPRAKYFEGIHHFNVPNGEWSLVVWEFPNTYRDKVTNVIIRYNLHGHQDDMADVSTFYFNKLELSVVEEDHWEGWNLDDRIAFCHSGYRGKDSKVALTQNSKETTFSLLEADSKKTVYTAPVRTAGHEIGTFQELDFTEFQEEGKYCIKIGDTVTKPFYIGENVWDSAIWKTINFFMQERCGMEIPGIHLPCHLDCFSVHPDGRKVSVGGGWHDAGDLSQGLVNTSESVHAFLDMAQQVQGSQPELYERLLDEARWGLNWMLKTRFGDGHRCVWTTIGLWTRNIIGDDDDIESPAHADPFANFCACGAEAAAVRLFRGKDDAFANYCLKCAKEDYRFAVERMSVKEGGANTFVFNAPCESQMYGQAGVAAMELYRVTQEEFYLKEAMEFAKVILACQQQEWPDWEVPVRGFFHETREKIHPYASEHRSHEQAPVMALSLLCRFAPDQMQDPAWEKGLQLYAEYIKNIQQYIQPYGLLPCAVYDLNHGNYDKAGRDACEDDGDYVDETAKDYADQVRNGIRLSDTHYLRRFPVAYQFRGFMGVSMTKAKAAAAAARALKDDELLEIARKQLEWIVGNNPFARSYMYGEGYDFVPLYSEFANDMVGEVPVGINTFEDHDVPFMPMMNTATYSEVWVHTSSRLLWTIADIY